MMSKMSLPPNGPKFAYFEGQIVPIEQAKISIMAHALNYGTAAFGGLRGYWNDEQHQLYLFRPIDHFTRLRQSADILMIDVPHTAEGLRDILIDLLRAEDYHENIYIRPLVYKAEPGIGVKLHDIKGDFCMFALPYGRYVSKEEGLSVGTSSWRRVDDTMIPARGKIAGAYANSALIKTEANLNGFDEAIVLSQDGHVSEASAANIFIYRKGKVITPPVSANVLEGITRQTIITLLTQELGLDVVEREIDRTELYSASEAFLTGTGVQIAAVTSVDHRKVGTGLMGDIVKQLRAVFFDVVRGELPKYHEWLQPVYVAEPTPAR
jgi:branched-chain amino acid aminotransferase